MQMNMKNILVVVCEECGAETLEFEYIAEKKSIVCMSCFSFNDFFQSILKKDSRNRDLDLED